MKGPWQSGLLLYNPGRHENENDDIEDIQFIEIMSAGSGARQPHHQDIDRKRGHGSVIYR